MKFILLLSLSITALIGLNAEVLKSEKKDLIKEIILMASGGSIEKSMEPMLNARVANIMPYVLSSYGFDEAKTQIISEKFLEICKKVLFSEESLDIYFEKMYPIYDNYYDIDDLKSIRQFYSTDTGQKLIQNMPLIMRDSSMATLAWTEEAFAQSQGDIFQEFDNAIIEFQAEENDNLRDYVRYYIFDGYSLNDLDKNKVFRFSGKLKNLQITSKHKVSLFIRLFRGNDEIVGEKIKEISSEYHSFVISESLSKYDDFETIQFGLIIEGPRINDSNNIALVELEPWSVKNSLNSNDSINATVSSNMNLAWAVGYNSYEHLEEDILAFSRWAEYDEVRFSTDIENRLLKVFANFE